MLVKSLTNFIKIVISLLLLLCLFKMPYGYYEFVRYALMFGFGALASYSYQKKSTNYELLIYLFLALLFQPIVKISLGKELWHIADLTIATALLISLFWENIFPRFKKKETSSSDIIPYANQELESFRVQLSALENQINLTSNEIEEIEKNIRDFSIRHTQELGETIKKILLLKRNRLEYEQHISREKKNEYEEVKKDYEEYEKKYEEVKSEKRFALGAEELIELKRKYRKATKLCHPDLVDDNFKSQAETLFNDLRQAYEQNDLVKVSEILDNLEKGHFFITHSEQTKDREKLVEKITNLENKLKSLKDKLGMLKESESYKTIIEIEDWESYFIEAKKKLLEQLESLDNNGSDR